MVICVVCLVLLILCLWPCVMALIRNAVSSTFQHQNVKGPKPTRAPNPVNGDTMQGDVCQGATGNTSDNQPPTKRDFYQGWFHQPTQARSP